jgi:hypothetical protein
MALPGAVGRGKARLGEARHGSGHLAAFTCCLPRSFTNDRRLLPIVRFARLWIPQRDGAGRIGILGQLGGRRSMDFRDQRRRGLRELVILGIVATKCRAS